MNCDITYSEKIFLGNNFPGSKNIEGRCDIILVYDSNFKEDIYEIANALQDAADFLKYVTCLDPAKFFNSRILVGHNKKATQVNWSRDGNRIRIPWKDKYLKKDEFLHSCAHELVHPFYRLSPLHKSNEKWGDAFCQFLRGPIKNIMGQDGKKWWHENIADQENGKNAHSNVAGQILKYAKGKYYNKETLEFCIENFINDKEKMKEFLSYLFVEYKAKSLCEIFTPVEKMKI